MPKLIQVGRKVTNPDNVDYIDLGQEGGSGVTVHFASQMCMEFTGADATQLWELVEEENFYGTSNPRP